MVNPLCNWIRIPFGTRLRILLRGSSFRGIQSQSPLKGLSGFLVAPGLVVPEQPIPVPVLQYFEFSMYFLLILHILVS